MKQYKYWMNGSNFLPLQNNKNPFQFYLLKIYASGDGRCRHSLLTFIAMGAEQYLESSVYYEAASLRQRSQNLHPIPDFP